MGASHRARISAKPRIQADFPWQPLENQLQRQLDVPLIVDLRRRGDAEGGGTRRRVRPADLHRKIELDAVAEQVNVKSTARVSNL